MINCTYEVTTNHGYETCKFCTHFSFRISVVKAFSLNSCTVEVLINCLYFTDLMCVELFSYPKNPALKNLKEGEKSLTSSMTCWGSLGRIH